MRKPHQQEYGAYEYSVTILPIRLVDIPPNPLPAASNPENGSVGLWTWVGRAVGRAAAGRVEVGTGGVPDQTHLVGADTP